MRRTWTEIAQSYREMAGRSDSVQLRALGDLADHIHRKHAGHSLYAWTSMYDLCIAQRDDQERSPGLDWFPHLRLSPSRPGHITFRYLDTMVDRKNWTRITPVEGVIGRFESFLEQMRWVPRISRIEDGAAQPTKPSG